MWVAYALASACLLGLYDVFKKEALTDNAVIPVLFLNTLFCSLLFTPSIVGSAIGVFGEGSSMYVPSEGLRGHLLVILKSVIVLGSWICGYYAIKKLPLTIVGPINATRPVLTLIGGMLIFGERLNLLQWAGVCTAVLSFYLLSRSGKKEGIDFKSNVWVLLLIVAAVLGAVSGLYDKFLMSSRGAALDRLFVQGWYNVYQCLMMGAIVITIWLPEKPRTLFSWKWSIPLISISLTAADLFYLYALTLPGAMISVVSMIRRSSVLVSFCFGVLILHEKNARSKATDLLLVLLSLVLLLVGTL